MAATVVEKLSTGSTMSWNAVTTAKIVDIGWGGEAPAQDITGQSDGAGATLTASRDYVAGLRENVSFRFGLIWDALDASHAALYVDFEAGTKRNVVFVTPDGTSYAFEAAIEELSEAQPLGSVIRADVVLMLTDAETLTPL